LPLPRPVPQVSSAADAVLAGGLRCPSHAHADSPLWMPQPLPARSAPGRPIDYPPKISAMVG
jgi:hypothetical protein